MSNFTLSNTELTKFNIPSDIINHLLIPIIQINNSPVNCHIWNYAACIGSLELIILLHNNNVPNCDTSVMNSAALHGYLHIIKWLHNNRTEGCNRWALLYSGLNNHTQIIQYLLDHPELDNSD